MALPHAVVWGREPTRRRPAARATRAILIAVAAVALLSGVLVHGAARPRAAASARVRSLPAILHHARAWPVPDLARWIVPGRELVRYRGGSLAAVSARIRASGGTILQRIAPLDVLVVGTGGHARVLRAALAAAPGVASAGPDVRQALLGIDCESVPGCSLPDDPGVPRQWYLNNGRGTVEPPGGGTAGDDIDAPLGWSIESGTTAVKLAVVDTGIDPTQPDVAPRIVSDQSLAADQGDSSDPSGHGTAVAGIAAAIPNNGIGIAGVAPAVSLMNVKVVTNSQPEIVDCAAVSAGIVSAANGGAQVINVSVGGPVPCAPEALAIDYAWNHGSLVVVAAGNGGNTEPMYPAAFNNVISVAATDAHDRPASFTSRGAGWIDLAAPGVRILTTLPMRPGQRTAHVGYVSGTSFAAPMVSGAAALLFAQGLTNEQVASRLLSSAWPIAGTGSAWRYGLLDVCDALANGAQLCPPPD